MDTITKKGEIKEQLEICFEFYENKIDSHFLNLFRESILDKKIKFPLLEYCAKELFKKLDLRDQIFFCEEIEKFKTIGGNVLLGILLQSRLALNYEESIRKSVYYISRANAWYVCDIIGERVWGFSLLHYPDKTILIIEKLSSHNSNWVVRSLGAGIHYAVKKGLPIEKVEKIFPILLSLANASDKEIRQGIGWAAKTIAKFHPIIITIFKEEIENKDKVATWFRTKIKIGLRRNEYIKRN